MTRSNNPNWKHASQDIAVDLEDERTIEILYSKYWDPLLNFAGKYISDKDTCKEIVQELFITLHLKRGQLTIKVSLASYLYGSIRNKIMNHLRKESIYKKHMAGMGKDINEPTPINDIGQLMDVTDLEKEIFCCINLMPDRYREVYVLIKLQACSLKKTAEMVNRPVQTVQRQLRKA